MIGNAVPAILQPFRRTTHKGVTLTGDRVVIRHPEFRDMVEWIAVRSKNQAMLRPFEPTWPDNALDESGFQRRLARQHHDIRHNRAHPFLIFRMDTLRLIGGINLNNIVRGAAQFAAMGYWLDEESQGQGLMTEAGMLALGFAFGPLKLERMNAACLPHNGRSKSLLQRLGFEEEGYAKKYLQIGGQRQDHILFGLDVDRWKKTLPGSVLDLPA